MHIGLGLGFQNLDRKITDAQVYRHELALAGRAEDCGFTVRARYAGGSRRRRGGEAAESR